VPAYDGRAVTVEGQIYIPTNYRGTGGPDADQFRVPPGQLRSWHQLVRVDGERRRAAYDREPRPSRRRCRHLQRHDDRDPELDRDHALVHVHFLWARLRVARVRLDKQPIHQLGARVHCCGRGSKLDVSKGTLSVASSSLDVSKTLRRGGEFVSDGFEEPSCWQVLGEREGCAPVWALQDAGPVEEFVA